MVVPGVLRVHHAPKVASASISAAMHGAYTQHAFSDEAGPEYRWGVVRHPLDRLVSAWAFFCRDGRIRNQPGLFVIGYEDGMRFVEFLRLALVRHNDNNHTRFQACFLGPHKFDRLGRFENLGDEWAALRKRFPVITRDIPWHHKTNHPDWRDMYDTEVKRYAELVFAADLALYEAAEG